jgi:hypothetical protein
MKTEIEEKISLILDNFKNNKLSIENAVEGILFLCELEKKSLENEKEIVIKSWEDGHRIYYHHKEEIIFTGEQYYNKTFGKIE